MVIASGGVRRARRLDPVGQHSETVKIMQDTINRVGLCYVAALIVFVAMTNVL